MTKFLIQKQIIEADTFLNALIKYLSPNRIISLQLITTISTSHEVYVVQTRTKTQTIKVEVVA